MFYFLWDTLRLGNPPIRVENASRSRHRPRGYRGLVLLLSILYPNFFRVIKESGSLPHVIITFFRWYLRILVLCNAGYAQPTELAYFYPICSTTYVFYH